MISKLSSENAVSQFPTVITQFFIFNRILFSYIIFAISFLKSLKHIFHFGFSAAIDNPIQPDPAPKSRILTDCFSAYIFSPVLITSSTRIYYENRNTPQMKPMEFINVPTGAAIFPAEIFITPRAWAEESYDLRHWTVMSEGGHFAALEKPELYLEDLRIFFRLLR